MTSSATTGRIGRFLGREREISQLVTLLGSARLITLTGPPGIGKTRLALRTAQIRGGPSTVVELAAVRDPALLPGAIASVLSAPEIAGRTLVDALAAHVGGRRLLLLLDNCEHLVAACAGVLARLLGDCPGLRVLATSREPLRLAAEHAWPVPPLAVPDAGATLEPEDALGYEAVSLFVERAAAARPGFALNSYLAPDVIDICRRLDGLPLAIELAAARAGTLSPAEIAARLDDRFALLTTATTSTTPGRHETLEAALDWSHDLLSSSEQAVLRRASVFVGGFDLEAAQAVCAGTDVEPGDVIELLERLNAKSLLVADGDSPARYRLLETVRAYGARSLERAGELMAVGRAHAGFYTALAERAEPELTGGLQRDWLTRLERERGNLRSAVEWSLGHGETDWALRLTGSVVLFWRVRCHFSEGRELLEAALMAGAGAAPALRVKALWGAGFMALMAGDEGGFTAAEGSLELAGALGDVRGRGRALLILGNARQYGEDPQALELLAQSAEAAAVAGDSWCLAHALGCAGLEHCHRDELTAARPLLERCVAIARDASDEQGLRFGLLGLGETAARQGEHELAESVFRETLAVAEGLGETYTRGTVLMHLGRVTAARGEYDRASEHLDEALTLLREAKPLETVPALVMRARVARALGDRARAQDLLEEALPLARAGALSGAAAVQCAGELVAEDGRLSTARRLCEEAVDLARHTGNQRLLSETLHGLGQLTRAEGDIKRAAALHREALQLRQASGDRWGIAVSLAAIGGLIAIGGRWDQAARFLGAAEAAVGRKALDRSGWGVFNFEPDVARLRQDLGAARLDALCAEGAAMALDEAVEQALIPNGDVPPTGWRSLSRAERQVAELVAEGLTNREISERLFVSLGSAKKTVSRVLLKLGCRRRAEVARELAGLDV